MKHAIVNDVVFCVRRTYVSKKVKKGRPRPLKTKVDTGNPRNSFRFLVLQSAVVVVPASSREFLRKRPKDRKHSPCCVDKLERVEATDREKSTSRKENCPFATNVILFYPTTQAAYVVSEFLTSMDRPNNRAGPLKLHLYTFVNYAI